MESFFTLPVISKNTVRRETLKHKVSKSPMKKNPYFDNMNKVKTETKAKKSWRMPWEQFESSQTKNNLFKVFGVNTDKNRINEGYVKRIPSKFPNTMFYPLGPSV